jgi:GLPGLI family protein
MPTYKNYMKKPLVVIIITVFIVSASCEYTDNQPKISSGKIDYKITYLNADLNKKTMSILPSRMKLMFNDKQAANNIEGFMGIYRLNAITNFHTRKCSTILKVLDKQYLFNGRRDEQMCCFDTMEGMEIQETNETKIIAGFNCKKSIIRLPATNETFDIYYTDEIDLKHPNSTNPYKNVKGVLMEFELNLLYLRMRFVAEKYQALGNNDFKNKLPEDSKVVSRDQMTQIMNKLMD